MALLVDIEKRLGTFSLKVRFESREGVLALLGASGSGKSMTLKCIAGIEKPDRGRIVLNDRMLFDSERGIHLPPQKRRVGYLFQQYALFPNMTVLQNIQTGVRARGGDDAAVRAMIRTMGLEGLEHLRPAQLSGGQQQRTALARILVNEPELLLLDEPFSALDSHLRFRLEREVHSILRAFGRPVLLVSHDRDEVYRLSDRVAILSDGRVDTIGPRDEVVANPATRSGAILTGCKNISPIRVLGPRRVLALDWNMELETAAQVTDAQYVGIRTICSGGGVNSFLCRPAEVIENPDSSTVLLSRCQEPGPGLLAWETDREFRPWGSLTVSLPPEGIILLKEGKPC